MPESITDLNVVNNEEGHRYEAWLGEALAGFTAYSLAPGLITFTHTQVADAFEGKGVATMLVRDALDDVRPGTSATSETGGTSRKVRPQCPFVKAFIGRHPYYQDLLYAGTD